MQSFNRANPDKSVVTARGLLDTTQQRFNASIAGRRDLALLLCHVLEWPSTRLFAWPETVIAPAHATAFNRLAKRWAKGEPVAHLTAQCEFWSLPLTASAAALIPRPETELLVELALTHTGTLASSQSQGQSRSRSQGRGRSQGRRMCLDLGTGGGAIALAFASERPAWQVFGMDQSARALAQAEQDRQRLALNNVEFFQGDWLQPGLNGLLAQPASRVDVLISNPPYIDIDDPHVAPSVRQFEPAQALFSQDNGLQAITAIIGLAPTMLTSGGVLILEHGWQQRDPVCALLRQQGNCAFTTHDDLAGHPRAICAIWNHP
jgi:release factor glutamine methyltransferase